MPRKSPKFCCKFLVATLWLWDIVILHVAKIYFTILYFVDNFELFILQSNKTLGNIYFFIFRLFNDVLLFFFFCHFFISSICLSVYQTSLKGKNIFQPVSTSIFLISFFQYIFDREIFFQKFIPKEIRQIWNLLS